MKFVTVFLLTVFAVSVSTAKKLPERRKSNCVEINCDELCVLGYFVVTDKFGCQKCECQSKSAIPDKISKSTLENSPVREFTWSEWGEFGSCNANCGFGHSFRSRECIGGLPEDCEGDSTERRSCYSCNEERWIVSECSAPCDEGHRYIIRQCTVEDGRNNCYEKVFSTEPCFKQACPLYSGGECYNSSKPNAYRGRVNKPIRDRKCYSWDHEDSSYQPQFYSEWALEENYCRNPNASSTGPWCYTNKERSKTSLCDVQLCPTTEAVYWGQWSDWSHCNASCNSGHQMRVRTCQGGSITQGGCLGDAMQVKECSENLCTENAYRNTVRGGEDCVDPKNPSGYRGTASSSIFGHECQRWDSQNPHHHSYTPSDFPKSDLQENYCRNPDHDTWPWCYTTNPMKLWEFCDVPECESEENVDPDEDCFVSGQAQEYRGTMSTTVSGHTCQYWDANTPHPHMYKSFRFPAKGLGHHNFCRSPDGDARLWCVTTRPDYPQFYEYCEPPLCSSQTSGNNSDCGPSNIEILPDQDPKVQNHRIVGGFAAKKGSIPWQVIIRTTNGYMCGGSIVDQSWIITAAHCLPSTDPRMYTGTAGDHILSTYEKEEVLLEFEKVFIHEEYDHETIHNDIALMKLTQPLTFNDHVRAICLPSASKVDNFTVGEKVLVSGWGRIRESGTFPEELQQVYVPLVDRKVCNELYGSQGSIYAGMLCAGYMDGGRDACSGDSGGPLVNLRTNELLGIVSWGLGCARDGYPGVYVYVPYYMDWVNSKMNE